MHMCEQKIDEAHDMPTLLGESGTLIPRLIFEEPKSRNRDFKSQQNE